MDRRTMLAATGAAAAMSATLTAGSAQAATRAGFPAGFRWGAATAGHQVEGGNVGSDIWLLEHIQPTLFQQSSGDACNSFELWATDLDLVKALNLDTYRFSLEWARIEPAQGEFSQAALDHYARIIDGCHARGITPMVTFSHFSLPRWFAALGGWTSPEAADLFARYCDKAARRLAAGMGYAVTLNEPNMIAVIAAALPPQAIALVEQMNAAAGRACGSTNFRNGMIPQLNDISLTQTNLLAAHKAGRAAIKAVRGDLPVGVSLTVSDDQAVGENSLRDQKRALYYGAWLDAIKGDDFVGAQNYARAEYTATGVLPPPKGVPISEMGVEVYAPSLAGSVRYVHEATGLPVMITEHGVGTPDDAIRAKFIPESLAELQKVVAAGVPVLGYVHWSLLDNFEWIFGYSKHFGLCEVDRATFKRTPKPSAAVLAGIAKANRV
ncbi:glycoside hydrolase family 1 protein [Caulobacter soli]|uniref:glycoside hydrolase family 1 protein n=1 Tax=Caulobacter soli TaxID=2708539 RepID=UPI00196A9B7D|nr:family 1 glycosylhydrolase [Caulobacter soli]